MQEFPHYGYRPGLYGVNTGCAPCAQRALGQVTAPRFDLGRDLTAGATAFALPLGYHYFAPKKWKRVGKLGNVVAVAGVYFLTAWIYGMVRERMA